MNKDELVDVVADKANVTKQQASVALTTALEVIAMAASTGDIQTLLLLTGSIHYTSSEGIESRLRQEDAELVARLAIAHLAKELIKGKEHESIEEIESRLIQEEEEAELRRKQAELSAHLAEGKEGLHPIREQRLDGENQELKLSREQANFVYRFALQNGASAKERRNFRQSIETLKQVNPHWELDADWTHEGEEEAFTLTYKDKYYTSRRIAYLATAALSSIL